MIVTGENRRTRRQTYRSANLSTINVKQADLALNPSLPIERPATDNVSDGMAFVETLS